MNALRDRTLDLLGDWTRIPSVAGDAPALRRIASAVADHLRGMGAELVPQDSRADPPLIHARFNRGAPVTILLYNMYDVMPAGSAGWSAPPFTGGLVDRPEGPSFVGRGAENNKGPLAGMLVALETLLPSLAANIELLVEGEEETGSKQLRRYLAAGHVQRCGAALFPCFCEYGGGPARVYLGSKGIAHGRIVVRGGDWGGPSNPIHSSNAPWIANPAWALVQALAGLSDGITGRVSQAPLPGDARPMLAELASRFDAGAELRFRSAGRYAVPGSTAELLEAVLTEASLSLSEIRCEPPGLRAAIPRLAEARFDLRLPPGLEPAAELAKLRARIPAHAELLVEDRYPGHRFAAEAPGVSALLATYRQAGVEPQLWPWAIGAMPAYAFAAVSPSFLIGGMGRGGNAHGPDEFVTLAGLDRYLDSMLTWLPATAAELAGKESLPCAC